MFARARLHKEVFVPLAHPPGEGQADFGEALVVIGGVEQKAHWWCQEFCVNAFSVWRPAGQRLPSRALAFAA